VRRGFDVRTVADAGHVVHFDALPDSSQRGRAGARFRRQQSVDEREQLITTHGRGPSGVAS